MMEIEKAAIQHDAETAAHEGQTPNQRCPHPFASEQGRYWTSCYWAMWERLRGGGSEVTDAVDAFQEERRSK